MNAHTPGPWELDSAGWPLVVNGPEFEHDLPDRVAANVVAKVESCDAGGSYYQYPCGIAEANARLIAAAPDLLETLRLAHQYFDADDSPDALRIRAAMLAAIGKATGETP